LNYGEKNARLLSKILKNMKFVKKTEEENREASNQYANLKRVISNIEPNSIFRDIHDPVKWQKEIRDEWEAH
jgi:Xaa-Pro aminopeptidase